ncbi:taurine transporter ATP-binding subunit [Antarctobacter heliothermus]|uniref:Taurine transporter ATP-binding subunit n=1 Tax=Antarctobacter heliothermus TaxID=74033 RepID=A0A222E6F0_9RHOB|nr:ABC transporter ATP-binding protein [Antarctobacter heliothermus]ASP21799.1 taurine transporter ATP-binding subunit [Antarctobacter heliothermus]
MSRLEAPGTIRSHEQELKKAGDPTAMGTHCELRGATRVYPGSAGRPALHALGPIDLELEAGRFYAVVGPSGCGKSTLLELLAGLASPSEGEVFINGQPIEGNVADGVGVVFQDDASFPWLTVWDNIAFGLRQKGVSENIISEKVKGATKLMGLTGFESAYPAQLSGGMRQRVCIARTLMMEPKLILLDEPFGALDQQTRLLMGDELLNLWRETGATVLLITHALDEAAMLADVVCVMSARPGVLLDVVETGWPRDRDSRIVSKPEFGAITSRLWSLLREESLNALDTKQRGS